MFRMQWLGRPRRCGGLILASGLATVLAGGLAGPGLAPARGEVLSLDLDPAASQVDFGFGATFHSVEGNLHILGGWIRFDTATGAAAGEIAADATTAQTGIKRRDRKMHEKILESQVFPTMVVNIERIDGKINRSGRSELQLHGTLNLHGVTHPVAIPAVAVVSGDQVRATGYLTVPYLGFGMRDPSFFILRVEKEVKVTLHIVGHLSPAAAVSVRAAPGPH